MPRVTVQSSVQCSGTSHFKHDVHEHHVGHIVGPKLVPASW
jgi:hypothetical protein